MKWNVKTDGIVFRPFNCSVTTLDLLVDGQPQGLAIAFDTVEGWVDHYVDHPTTGIKLDVKGNKVVERTRGRVEVRRKP